MTAPAIVLTVTAVFIPVFFCGGFYYGFRTAEAVYVERMVKKENIPFLSLWGREKHSPETFAETSRQRRARILAENVENYGTDVPQKEVE